MPDGNARNVSGRGVGRNRRYDWCASTVGQQPMGRYSQSRDTWQGSGHGHRWQYALTEVPRWARTWPGRCWSLRQDASAERADLERLADVLEDRLAAIKVQLESLEGEERTGEPEHDTSVEQEQL